MKIESDDIHDYLRVTEVIDWDNPNVLAKSKEIVEGVTDNIKKIKYLFEWVRDEIPHSKDINSGILELGNLGIECILSIQFFNPSINSC